MVRTTSKAQITLELLLLFAVFLSFLIFWIPLVEGAKNDILKKIRKEYMAHTVADLKNQIDEICVLGPGNKRAVNVNLLSESKISYYGKTLTVTDIDSQKQISVETQCEIESDAQTINKEVLIVENIAGKIKIYKNKTNISSNITSNT
jgi:hypothetical protein